jgi:hypothetical protein
MPGVRLVDLGPSDIVNGQIQWDAVKQANPAIRILAIHDATLGSLPSDPAFTSLEQLLLFRCDLALVRDDLWRTRIDSLVLAQCTGLVRIFPGTCSVKWLTLRACDVDTIGPLDQCTSLTSLQIEHTDIAQLPLLPSSLQRVHLSGLRQCEDDGQLHNLPVLQDVHISGSCHAFGGSLIGIREWRFATARCRALTLVLASQWRVRRTRCLRPLPRIPAEIWEMIWSFTN